MTSITFKLAQRDNLSAELPSEQVQRLTPTQRQQLNHAMYVARCINLTDRNRDAVEEALAGLIIDGVRQITSFPECEGLDFLAIHGAIANIIYHGQQGYYAATQFGGEVFKCLQGQPLTSLTDCIGLYLKEKQKRKTA